MSYADKWLLAHDVYHPVFFSTAQCFNLLLRHQHSLPNKGWPVRSSDLWTWSVYNILALSSLAIVIITKFYICLSSWRNIFYKFHLSLLPVVGHDVLCNTIAGWQVATQLLLSALIQMEIFLNSFNMWLRAQFTFSLICRCSIPWNQILS